MCQVSLSYASTETLFSCESLLSPSHLKESSRDRGRNICPPVFMFSFLYFQVIVEKAPKARIGDLDKKKYLVPSDLTGISLV